MMDHLSPVKPARLAPALIGILAILQVVRVFALAMIPEIQGGRMSQAWLFPAGLDVFVGVAGVFVALGVWFGRGLGIWTAAIVFFALSISDHADAVTVVLNNPGPLPSWTTGEPTSTVTMLLVMSFVEAFAVWGLTTRRLRSHFLRASAALSHQ